MSNVTLPLKLYGWAKVNGDGTIVGKSPNLTVTRGSTGNYAVQPAQHFDDSQLLALVTGRSSGPFIFSTETGHGPTSDGVLVLAFNGASSGAASDEPFNFVLYTIGESDFSSLPVY